MYYEITFLIAMFITKPISSVIGRIGDLQMNKDRYACIAGAGATYRG